MMSKRSLLTACLLVGLTASTATAQLVGGVTDQLGGAVGQAGGAVGQMGGADQLGNSLPGAPGMPGLGGLDGLSGIGEVPGITDLPGATLAGGSGSSNSPSARFLRGAIMPSLDRVVAPMGYVRATPGQMAQLRKARLEVLVRSNKNDLETGPDGLPVRRGELIVTNPDAASLAMALRAGFRIRADDQTPELGLRMVTLSLPQD